MHADPPHDIFDLSDQVVDEFAAIDPIDATDLGIVGHDSEWPDLSPGGWDDRREFWARTGRAAAAVSATSAEEEVAKRVLEQECASKIDRIDRQHHLADLNNIASPWQTIRTAPMEASLDTTENWLDAITRLETIDRPLDGYRESLEAGLGSGMSIAARQVDIAIDQGRRAADAGSSFDEMRSQFDAAPAADGSIRPRLDAAITHAKASFASVTDWLETSYRPRARDRDAVGRDHYMAEASHWLGQDIDPDSLYQWGWDEVERLRRELTGACAAVDREKSEAEVMTLLETDPSRAAGSVEEFIELMQSRQDRAVEALDGVHFDVDPRIRTVEVRTAPAGGATAAYYMGPSEDFTKPGRVWYPVDGRTTFPLFEEITTAYHEGFPGHHLQLGSQVAAGDAMSRFHRMVVWYPGSGEGWALYAERLMGELGFLDRPDYEIGLLIAQLVRSCRIVIDIGCHLELDIPAAASFHPGQPWTFELAVEMLRTVAHQTPANAESEVTRYLGWPGQAIAYKVGEQAILDLRAARASRTEADPKQFHADVLNVGAIGLDLMRELVEARAG